MATMTIYCDVVTGASFTNPENAQGSPSAGNAAPFATGVIVGPLVLTGSFAGVVVPGTVAAVSATMTARASLTNNISIEAALSGVTFGVGNTYTVQATNFATGIISGTVADPGAMKSALATGITGYTLTAVQDLGTPTIEIKGMGLVITYTPFEDPASPGDADVGLAKAVLITHLE